MDRIAMLSEILTANPEDLFARYGLALEYSKAGQIEQALQEFKALIAKNPDYTPARAASMRPSECWSMAFPAHAAPATRTPNRR
ncbi:MAG: tetratricopeptide repeat protein [Terriglobales bacterium]